MSAVPLERYGSLDLDSVAAPETSLPFSFSQPLTRRRRLVRHLPSMLLLSADIIALSVVAAVSEIAAAPLWTFLLALVGWLAATGCYRVPRPPLWMESAPRLVRHASLPSLAFLLLHGAPSITDPSAHLIMAAIGGILVARLVALAGIRTARRSGLLRSAAVIVGGGQVGRRIARSLQLHPLYGMDVQGYVDTQPRPKANVPYLGGVEELAAIVAATEAEIVIVSFVPASDSTLVELLRWTSSRDIEVLVVPRMFDVAASTGVHGSQHIWGVPVIRMGSGPQGTLRWAGKRAFDVLASATGLLLLAPLLIGLAVGVRLSSPGPVLFRQTRVGQYDRPFELLKFRSMPLNDDSDTTWNVLDDDRVTPLGRSMRKYSLDEFPQLLNVLRGDMSLVGPRPERPMFVDNFGSTIPSYSARHRVPVGVTGWAQVNGLRGDTSIEERARFDNAYVEQWSVWRDITILLRTASAVFKHPG